MDCQPIGLVIVSLMMHNLGLGTTDKTLVGGYHLPLPGFGHVVPEGSGYRWLPADWQWTT